MATDDQLVNYLVGDDDGHGLDPGERRELDEITSLLADVTLWDDPPPTLGADVVAAIVAERAAGAGSPGALASSTAAAARNEPPGSGTVSPISSAPRRRRQWLTPFLAGVAVAAAIIGALVLVATRDDSNDTAGGEGTE